MRRALLVLALPLAVACGGGGGGEEAGSGGGPGLGEAVGQAGADTRLLHEAQGAANKVIRNATDCDAARAAYPEAQRQLDAADKAVQTAAGKTSLQALRLQVKRVMDVCP